MQSVLIVKVGQVEPIIDPALGDYEDWITRGLNVKPEAVHTCSVYLGDTLPSFSELSGIVVTGAAAMVTDCAPWSEQTARWMGEAVQAEVPLLGICYGHQLLAYALGGVVDYNPNGREIGTVDIHLNAEGQQDDLLGHLSTSFLAQVSHSQSVVALPEAARLLAYNTVEPHHAFSVGCCAWGVQFHPEFDVFYTRALINDRKDALQKEGFDVDELLAQVCETPESQGVLKRFGDLIQHL